MFPIEALTGFIYSEKKNDDVSTRKISFFKDMIRILFFLLLDNEPEHKQNVMKS